MNSLPLLYLLRLLHIVTGIFWVGGVMLVAGFILPSVRALGSAGAPMMNQLMQVRKLPAFLLVSGWVTVLSGLGLYARAGSLSASAFFASWPGRIFGLGGLLGLFVVLMGTFGNLPTAKRMMAVGAQLQASGATPAPELAAEMQRLQMRLRRLTETAAVLLGMAAVCMAIARYT